MANREARVTREETEKKLTQRRKGAKVKTHAELSVLDFRSDGSGGW